jgi:translation elongation factor EF-G
VGGGDFRGDCASAASVGLIPVTSPIELAGAVISRRTTGLATLTVLVPLAEIADYQSRLKALTGREGAYLRELSHYDRSPRAASRSWQSPTVRDRMRSEA